MTFGADAGTPREGHRSGSANGSTTPMPPSVASPESQAIELRANYEKKRWEARFVKADAEPSKWLDTSLSLELPSGKIREARQVIQSMKRRWGRCDFRVVDPVARPVPKRSPFLGAA